MTGRARGCSSLAMFPKAISRLARSAVESLSLMRAADPLRGLFAYGVLTLSRLKPIGWVVCFNYSS
jgi:hypothetical protein